MVKVIARNFAQEDKLNEIIEFYKELVELTRKEKGCIKYELYVDEKDSTILTMIEEWESIQALDEHFKSKHFTRIVPILGELMSRESEMSVYNKLI